ncbi:MAG TPA: hypothetical protein VEL31_05435 [Ktedonobacteraceae bacterium]|nr:hypothetical protein [Ktedonobacteraceae bacterium]
MTEKATNTKQEKYPIGSLEEMSQHWHIVGGGGAKEPKDESDTTPPSFGVRAPETQSALTSDKEKPRRQTVYLPADLYRWIRHRGADTDQDISEVVVEALTLLRSTVG